MTKLTPIQISLQS